MFGKNRTAPVPAHGKHSLSLKPEKASESLEGFIPDNVGRVRISDEALDSIIDLVEAHMLDRSKVKQVSGMEVSHTHDGYWVLSGYTNSEYQEAQTIMAKAKEQFIEANPLIDSDKVVVVNGEFKHGKDD
jgi:hypothetical protein